MTVHILWPVFYGKPSGKCCEVKGQNHLSGMIPFTRWCLFAILGDDPREQIEEERRGLWEPAWLCNHSRTLQLPDLTLEESYTCGEGCGTESEDFGKWCVKCTQVGRKSKLWPYGNGALPLKKLTWEYLPRLSHTHRGTQPPQWQKMGWGTMYTTPAKQNTAQFSLQNTSWKTKKEKKMKHILETSYTPHISFCSMTQNRLAKILTLFIMTSKGWRLQGKGPLHKRNPQLIFAEMEFIPLDSQIHISLGRLWEIERTQP